MNSPSLPLGFLMLDTRFPRITGDAGCAATWNFPARYHVVTGASAARVVRRRAENLLPAFIDGGRQLARAGVCGVSTTCGFLCLQQKALAQALPLPVLTSALLSGGDIIRRLPPRKRLGILTASQQHLTEEHLRAAGINPRRAVIGGLPPRGYFARVLLEDGDTLDPARAARDMLAAADALLARANNPGNPDSPGSIAALLLECANMPPYSNALRAHTGLPVYSIIDAVNHFYRRITSQATAAPPPGLGAV